jgi:hypothetical protein
MLFIMAAVFGVIAANENLMMIGTMIYFFMALSCAGIGVVPCPFLKKTANSWRLGQSGYEFLRISSRLLALF